MAFIKSVLVLGILAVGMWAKPATAAEQATEVQKGGNTCIFYGKNYQKELAGCGKGDVLYISSDLGKRPVALSRLVCDFDKQIVVHNEHDTPLFVACVYVGFVRNEIPSAYL